jgi:hypothetical protein
VQMRLQKLVKFLQRQPRDFGNIHSGEGHR